MTYVRKVRTNRPRRCTDDGDGGSGGTTISRADFVARANHICQVGNAKLAADLGQLGANGPTPDKLIQYFAATGIPLLRDQVSQLRALGFPTADAAVPAPVFDDLDAILDRAEADPSLMMMDSKAHSPTPTLDWRRTDWMCAVSSSAESIG